MHYDDTNLRRLYAALSTANRRKALKGAFRRTATYVRKTAERNLRGTGIGNAEKLRRGIRQMVFSRAAGFCVTIAPRRSGKNGKGGRGMHTNRRGLKKPVLRWAETGTKKRRAKKRVRFRGADGRWATSGYGRGMMPRYGFMSATKSQVEGEVTRTLHKEVRESVIKTAKKYGCY